MVATHEFENQFAAMTTGFVFLILFVGIVFAVLKPKRNVFKRKSGLLEAHGRLQRLESVHVWIAPMEKSHRFGL